MDVDAMMEDARAKRDLVRTIEGAQQAWCVIQDERGRWQTVAYRPTPEAFGWLALHMHRTLAELSAQIGGET